MPSLLDPITIGAWSLPHRVLMAPLTRCRARRDGTPTPLMVDYYRQRARPGGLSLLISEATNISQQGQGYPNTPGLFHQDHVHGWLPVTAAVADQGATIVAQLWHVGRMSHPDFQPPQPPHPASPTTPNLPVAPSALDPGGTARTYEGVKPRVTPRALERHEIPAIINDYRIAARLARLAGFHGVELHAANG